MSSLLLSVTLKVLGLFAFILENVTWQTIQIFEPDLIDQYAVNKVIQFPLPFLLSFLFFIHVHFLVLSLLLCLRLPPYRLLHFVFRFIGILFLCLLGQQLDQLFLFDPLRFTRFIPTLIRIPCGLRWSIFISGWSMFLCGFITLIS